MPNRIIKESICTSEDIACLSMGAEILFYRLIVKADDFGCYYGNEAIIKNTCFPLKTDEQISVQMVTEWVQQLERSGLILLYTAADGRKYLQLTKWEKHQRIRAKQSKFPQFDDTCRQMTADVRESLSNVSVIQSNPIRIQSNPKVGKNKFSPPTLEEIRAYCSERGNHVDAERFFNYYTSNGWKVGKNAMKDWKAAIRTWERDDKAKKGPAMKTPYDGLRTETNGDDLDKLARLMGVSSG